MKYFAKDVVKPSGWCKKNVNQFALFYKDCCDLLVFSVFNFEFSNSEKTIFMLWKKSP